MSFSNIHPKDLNKSLQDWTRGGLSDPEIKVANEGIKKEQTKFPDHLITGIVTKVLGSKISTEFFYKKKPPRSTNDKINGIIDGVKKGKIRVPKL